MPDTYRAFLMDWTPKEKRSTEPERTYQFITDTLDRMGKFQEYDHKTAEPGTLYYSEPFLMKPNITSEDFKNNNNIAAAFYQGKNLEGALKKTGLGEDNGHRSTISQILLGLYHEIDENTENNNYIEKNARKNLQNQYKILSPMQEIREILK